MMTKRFFVRFSILVYLLMTTGSTVAGEVDAQGQSPSLSTMRFVTSDGASTIRQSEAGLQMVADPKADIASRITASLGGRYRKVKVSVTAQPLPEIENPNFEMQLGQSGTQRYVGGGQQLGQQLAWVRSYDSVHQREQLAEKSGLPWTGSGELSLSLQVDLDAGTLVYTVGSVSIETKLKPGHMAFVDSVGFASFRQGARFTNLIIDGDSIPVEKNAQAPALDQSDILIPPARRLADSTDLYLKSIAGELSDFNPGEMVWTPDAAMLSKLLMEENPPGLVSVTPVQAMPFADALRIELDATGPDYWSQQIKFPNQARIRKDDVVYYTLFARTLVGGGSARVKWNQNTTDAQHFGPDIVLTDQWTRKHFWWRATQDLAPGELAYMFSFGFAGNKAIEIGGMVGVVLPPTTDVQRLPAERIELNYPGRAADAQWRKDALARIEQIRKADLVVNVADAEGKPASGATVEIELIRHAFPFATVVDMNAFPGVSIPAFGYWGDVMEKRFTPADKEKYLEKLKENFNAAVTVGPGFSTFYPGHELIPEVYDATFEWLKKHNFTILQNDIVYRDEFWPAAAKEPMTAGDTQRLLAVIDRGLEQYFARFGESVSTVALANEWDINRARNLFATRDDPNGHALALHLFRTAHRLAPPHVKIGINDPHASEGYYQRVRDLKSKGAKIDWVGFQWHFGVPGHPPEQMLADISRFAALGVDIEVTEFDFALSKPTDADQLAWQRDYARDAYIAAFSSPHVVGITKWGFWERSIWDTMRGKATAFYNDDWSITPLGKVYQELILGEWKTHVTDKADASGKLNIRGFKGDYRITVTHDGKTKSVDARLDADRSVNVRLD